MADTSRIAAWFAARTPHEDILRMTMNEIIVVLLERIEALEARMHKTWNNIEWTPEQMAVINQIKLDAARELAEAERKWRDMLNAALLEAAQHLEEERVAWNKQHDHATSSADEGEK